MRAFDAGRPAGPALILLFGLIMYPIVITRSYFLNHMYNTILISCTTHNNLHEEINKMPKPSFFSGSLSSLFFFL